MNLFYPLFNKKVTPFLLITFLFVSFFSSISAQISSADWDLNTATARNFRTLPAIPSTALNTTISIEKFKRKLHSEKQEIQIPNPEGRFETFVIEPNNVVASEVAHLYTIKTFKGYKKDDPTVLFAGDISDSGFHGGIYAGQNSYFIEPINTNLNAANQLRVYYKRESKANKVKCLVKETARRAISSNPATKRSALTQKLNFRLAIVAAGEFGQEFGGTPFNVTNVLNALASGVNMINPIYLRDIGIDFTLVSTADMVFDNPEMDNLDISDENDFFQNLNNIITNAIGVDGYDVGHAVIWANLGGLAAPGVVCDEVFKSDGYSAADASTVTLWVDYVGHEIGHQFNADHNFVSTECATSVDGFRYEPGEGSSIMAYAGVCGAPAAFAAGSDPFFHYASIKTMTDFIETIGCGTITSSENSGDPVSNAQSDITIPKQTPFVLVGSASDPNDAASSLTYSWEQYDGNSDAVNGPPDCNSTNAPLFRFRPPNTTGIRSFPQYTDVLAGNNNAMDWEKLPCNARDINFSLATRDNNPVFGRVTNDLMKVTVANTGPFAVTAPNGGENLTSNTTSMITWTVNGTDTHCSNIDILLSTDGGATYTVIADATANDGTESVMIPNSVSTTARIIIRCDVTGGFRSASTFYDVSDADFVIAEGATSACVDNGGDADMDGVCADKDCNDNDANIGAKQAVGTMCDDGDATTENDQIQSDSCTCAGTVISACANNGGDADMDGFCADVDCDDNNPNINSMATEIPDNGIDENCDGMDEVTTGMGDDCPIPSDAQVTIISSEKVSIEWPKVAAANAYTIQLRFKGQERWLITAKVRTNKVFVYAPANRVYEYRLKSSCANGDSEYSAIFEYLTPLTLIKDIAESRNNEDENEVIDLFNYIEATVQLFPNPVQDKLNIQLTAQKAGTITIYHTSGLMISQQQVVRGESTHRIEVGHLDAGLYFISVEEAGKQTVSKRFVKM